MVPRTLTTLRGVYYGTGTQSLRVSIENKVKILAVGVCLPTPVIMALTNLV